MKKVFLLLTLMLVGANQLYGMEPQYPGMAKMGAFGEMPTDILPVIIQQAIESSNTLDKAIKAVNVASALQGVKYDNLKDFTKLVHLLADKFNITTQEVAEKFGTPTAKKYIELGQQLRRLASYSSRGPNNEIETSLMRLINKDNADVNFSVPTSDPTKNKDTPLDVAIYMSRIEAIKILLSAGAKPTVQNISDMKRNNLFTEEIQQMIKK